VISIVMPVYNAEEYLRRCIQSILEQTYSDYELICVDDGSTDGSFELLMKYSQDDNRITVVHQENLGQFCARRNGTKLAGGEFVTFIDADDWVAANMLEKMHDMQDESQCDIVCSGLYRAIGDKYTKDGNTINEGVYRDEELANQIWPYMLCDGRFFRMGVRPNLVGKLIKKTLFLDACSNAPTNIINGEDLMITYLCLLNAKSILLTNEAWYYYRQHANSITQKKTSEKDILSIHELYGFLTREFNKYSLKDTLNDQLCSFMAHLLIQREMEELDNTPGELRAFGGISHEDKVALYGAGRFGKQIHYYLEKNGFDVLWVDKEAKEYQKQGLLVKEREELLKTQYDILLIGVIDEGMTSDICNGLQSLGVDNSKIRCLDVEYITSVPALKKWQLF